MNLYQTNFTQVDSVIVVVYLLGSLVIGIWANRYVGNLSDYLVAGRTLRIRLALASMTGTEFGLVTFMYMSELGFLQQFAALYLGVLEGVAVLTVGLTGFLVYRLRQTEVMTVPEYYQRRFSPGVRVVGGTMMVLSGVLNMGLFLKAGSQFITAISGLQDEMYLKWIMTGLLLLVLFYTVLGGMVSVVITDLIQFFVLGVGMVVVTGFVVYNIGLDGFQHVVTQYAGCYDPTDSVNRSATLLPAATQQGIGYKTIFQMAAIIGSASLLWPPMASRTLAVQSSEVAQRLYRFSPIPLLARNVIPIIWGIAAYYYFATNDGFREALSAALADESVQTWSAMPLYLSKVIPTGCIGLVTAGMVAAFMSTHDSYLLCWSGVITQDILGPLFGPFSQRTRILITRIGILAIGAVLLTWGLWYELSSNLWNYMAVTGTVYLAGALPVVAGGLYWKRASTAGAYFALLGGLTGLLAMDPSIAMLKKLGLTVSGADITLLAFAVSAGGFVAGSLLWPNRKATPGRDETTN